MSATNIFCCQERDCRSLLEVFQLKAVLVKQVFCWNIPSAFLVWSVGEGVFRPMSSRAAAAARCRLSWKENFKQTKAMLLRCSGSAWCIIHVKGSKHQQSWHSSTTWTSHPVQLQCTRICYYRKLNMIIVGCFYGLAGVVASAFSSQRSLSFCMTVPLHLTCHLVIVRAKKQVLNAAGGSKQGVLFPWENKYFGFDLLPEVWNSSGLCVVMVVFTWQVFILYCSYYF